MCVCMHVHACACVHVHVCACMYTSVGGHPPTTPIPHNPPPQPTTHPPTPRATGNPKHQNSISLKLIEIIQFCLKILYLWTFLNSHRLKLITPEPPHPPVPPPRAEETEIGRITITLERIEIIQFCLKICDPWTLLHTYRLGLMCRWGGVLPQMALLCFWPKKVLLWPSNKKISYFCTGFH